MPVLGVVEGDIVSTPESGTFAEEWSAAWNRGDGDADLSRCAA